MAGFFTTGTSAQIPAGSAVSAFLDEDVPVAGAPVDAAPIVAAQPAPAVVPAVATQAAPAPTTTAMQR
ncbi:hypothetical protein [Sphingomonas montanisoli]|uniref:Uncharacterized protein n=1 Tax=Sphingomonas montanisoli TaxID=2606412 RepID=A0A5D9C7E0_9SPHN|nr:hypothetical protein FYJ91_13410 [Sphingomonas montanisoli]